jgi:glyoxylase-like metal-dependent hydrolase (beta-lactamase superfamily II)
MTQPWHESVRLVDMHYLAPERAASYIVIEGGRAAIIDHTKQGIPHMQAELATHGLSFEDVEYLIITHVHLDHAGGTGRLAQLCPNAKVLAHPKAARHLISPERIIAGSRAVYGDEMFEQLYGEIVPIPESQVRAMQDGETIAWGKRTLRFEYALGHASHHFVIYDDKSNGVFTGDMLGMGRSRYLAADKDFVHCITAPPDFDAAEWKKHTQKLVDSGARWAFIAHFGVFDNIPARVADLVESLDASQAIVEAAAASDMDDAELTAWCIEQVGIGMDKHLTERGIPLTGDDRRVMDPDQMMNGMGLAHAARRLRTKQPA